MAEHFKPSEIWTNGYEPPESEQDEWNEFEDRLRVAGVVSKTVARQDVPIAVGGVKVQLMYPSEDMPNDVEINDTSIVMKLVYNDVSILFTGDLEKDGERTLLSNGDDLSATVLKVGHHGSDTSSIREFVDAVGPDIALISVGQLNEYGMPDKDVLNRLKEVDAKIYRTDLHGAIDLSTDGEKVEVSTAVDGQ